MLLRQELLRQEQTGIAQAKQILKTLFPGYEILHSALPPELGGDQLVVSPPPNTPLSVMLSMIYFAQKAGIDTVVGKADHGADALPINFSLSHTDVKRLQEAYQAYEASLGQSSSLLTRPLRRV